MQACAGGWAPGAGVLQRPLHRPPPRRRHRNLAFASPCPTHRITQQFGPSYEATRSSGLKHSVPALDLGLGCAFELDTAELQPQVGAGGRQWGARVDADAAARARAREPDAAELQPRACAAG